MAQSSTRLAAWWRWFRRSYLPSAFVAIVFVCVLSLLSVYGIMEKHGFHLAGGW
ncbi:hypothetical protein GS501_01785 [Saccharibacter sp. 17.LH.SD]|uniref:hypothetical protein n=1 Tax=Saccharibacter sp. 17.LH.SD TaxID=2689393 RepID=UPI00136D1B90|nr:hypothetical protein [Saccharibacter sp. 17.LH.SD]MXV43784.1 hypothetical protein [Saccharibacter sp. 17.LH.SD]